MIPNAILAAAALAAVIVIAHTLLRAWNGWLDLKRLELNRTSPEAATRIDLADMRERLRKLEAIAEGLY